METEAPVIQAKDSALRSLQCGKTKCRLQVGVKRQDAGEVRISIITERLIDPAANVVEAKQIRTSTNPRTRQGAINTTTSSTIAAVIRRFSELEVEYTRSERSARAPPPVLSE